MIYVVKIWIDKDNLYAESDSGKVAFINYQNSKASIKPVKINLRTLRS